MLISGSSDECIVCVLQGLVVMSVLLLSCYRVLVVMSVLFVCYRADWW